MIAKSQTPTEVLENVLERLSGVTSYGASWKALCPAHSDRRPSLTIKTGYRGLLVKCWAGCSLSDICQAIGLTESSLFFDAPSSPFDKKRGTVHERVNLNWRWNWRKQIFQILNITEVQGVLAEDFLGKVQSLPAESLNDEQRDFLLEKISLAYSWIDLSESLAELCFDVAQSQRRWG